MPYTVAGTLKLPETGQPAAGVILKFIALQSISPVLDRSESVIVTSRTGAYSIQLEYNTYSVFATLYDNKPINCGQIVLNSTVATGLDLPTLLNGGFSEPTTPSWIVELQRLANVTTTAAQAAAASAAASSTSAASAAASAAQASQISGLSTVAEAIGLAALPLPDVWAPLTDSLRLFTGYGREVKVGDDVVARMLTFTRSTTKTYINRDGVWATAAVNEPTFDQWGLQLDGQSPNVFNKASGTNFSWISEGLTQSAGTAQLPFDVFQKTITSSTSNPTHIDGVLVDIYNMPNPAASGGGPVTASVIMFGDADAILAADPRLNMTSNLPITNITYSAVKLTSGMVRVVSTGIITAGSATNLPNFQLRWLNRLPSFVVGCYQIEALPVASSYIPTNGSAVTRAADLLTLQNPLNIPVGAGDMTVAFEVRRNQTIPSSWFPKIFQIGPSTWVVGDSTRFAMRGGTTDQGALLKPAPGEMETVVYRIKGDQIVVRCGNATATLTRTGGVTWNNTVTNIGSDGSGVQNLFGYVRNLRVWRRALTDDQMKAIA